MIDVGFQHTSLPFGPRKVIVRRAAMELFPGAICNLGAGVSTGLSVIAAEEGLLDAVHLTNEQGIIGGAPIRETLDAYQEQIVRAWA